MTSVEVVKAGEGRVVFLHGEPGVGKTRLAQEVVERARASGAQVCVGWCFEQHTRVPFFPFTEALAVPHRGQALFADQQALQRWPELARLLDTSRPEHTDQDDGTSQLQVFRAITAFVREAADVRPIVLLFDDLQWADSTSLSLLLYLCRHVTDSRIFVLGTYRDTDVDRRHPLAEIVRDLVRERIGEDIPVRRLPLGGTADLVRAQLGDGAVSDELVTLLHDRADGNPFFTEELLKSLIESETVSQFDGVWTARPNADLRVPRSVRSVINQRFIRLAEDARLLLQLASAVGHEFEFDVLLASSGQPEAVVLDTLDAALAAGSVVEHPGAGRRPDTYQFAHTLIRQTLYDELPVHRRRVLHLQLGHARNAGVPCGQHWRQSLRDILGGRRPAPSAGLHDCRWRSGGRPICAR